MKKVIVVGAGIVGAATAYELVRKGMKVILIDEHFDGRATSAAAGIICPWITKRRNKAWYELAKRGAAYYEKNLVKYLANDGEKEIGYKKVGALKLHTERNRLEELEKLAYQRRESAPQMGEISLLNKEETSRKFPFLNDTYYSLFIEGAARVDGRALRNSLIQACLKRGATYIEGVAKLMTAGTNIVGIKVSDKKIFADMTVATNGVWMPELLLPLGIELNILAQKGEIIHLQTETVNTSSLPVVMPPNNQYLLSFDEGRIVIGATHENRSDFQSKTTAGGIHYILDQALQIAPLLAGCAITEMRVGFRPFTFNHLPVFGSVPPFDRLLIANGLGASGLTTGPFIGKQLAKMINGEKPDLKVDDYKVEQILKS